MKDFLHILLICILCCFATSASAGEKENADFDVAATIFEHLGDSYEWHIAGDELIDIMGSKVNG